MNSVTDLVRALEVTPATIRRWSGEYGEFLSPHASPPKGQTRLYTDDDAAALALVAAMRRVNSDYQTICAALADGSRSPWPPETDQPGQDDAGSAKSDDAPTMALVTQLTARASQWEATAATIADERDHLRTELKQAQDARLQSEIRATEAETELRILKDLTEDKTPPTAKMTWWQRVFGIR